VNTVKCLLAACAVFLITSAAHAAGSVYVLCYHTFINGKKSMYDFSIDELRHQVNYFKSKGFTFVSFTDIEKGKVRGDKNILVSIDDGNESVYRAYKEVLKPNGIKPLLGIYPCVIERKDYAMKWHQIRELAYEGCDIASHGYYHMKMNKKFYENKRKDFLFEINKSKEVIEQKVNRPVTVFIYPFGLYIKEVYDHLQRAGYKYAMNIRGSALAVPLRAGASFEMPRYLLTRGNINATMAAIHKMADRRNRIAAAGLDIGDDNKIVYSVDGARLTKAGRHAPATRAADVRDARAATDRTAPMVQSPHTKRAVEKRTADRVEPRAGDAPRRAAPILRRARPADNRYVAEAPAPKHKAEGRTVVRERRKESFGLIDRPERVRSGSEKRPGFRALSEGEYNVTSRAMKIDLAGEEARDAKRDDRTR